MKNLYTKILIIILIITLSNSTFSGKAGRYSSDYSSLMAKAISHPAPNIDTDIGMGSDDDELYGSDGYFTMAMSFRGQPSHKRDHSFEKHRKMDMIMGQEEDMADQFLFLSNSSLKVSMQPYGHYEEQRRMSREDGHDSRGSGVIFKAEHWINKEFSMSATLGTDLTTFETKANNEKGHTQTKTGGIHAGWKKDNYLLGLGVLGSWYRHRGSREIQGTGLWASETHEGYGVVPHINLSYHAKLKDGWHIMPYGQLILAYNHQNGYTEEGGGANNARTNNLHSSHLRSVLGAGIYKSIAQNGWQGLYGVTLSWINGLPLKKGHLNRNIGGTNIQVRSNERTKNRISPALIMKMQDKKGFFVSFHYISELGTRYHAHGGAIQIGKRL